MDKIGFSKKGDIMDRDYIVVGAGFTGTVFAERIASQFNKKVLVIDKRAHIGGNAYDCCDDVGIIIHKYGPHIFHTNNKEVWDYINSFTEWTEYLHQVLAHVDGRKVRLPINLNSIEQLFPKELAQKYCALLKEKVGPNKKAPILKLLKSDCQDLRNFADVIYCKIFVNYTCKQWGKAPDEIDETVTGRIPIRVTRCNQYFQDRYQGLPKYGYTRMFENILSHRNINLLLNTDFSEMFEIGNGEIRFLGKPYRGCLLFTGPIDEFFNHCLGQLPYRAIKFKFETYKQNSWQEAPVINYPNDNEFTRVTEYRKLTSQQHKQTTISKEYPADYNPDILGRDNPCYPVLDETSIALLDKYRRLADNYKNVIFAGRLGKFKYLDMDDAIGEALSEFNKESKRLNHRDK